MCKVPVRNCMENKASLAYNYQTKLISYTYIIPTDNWLTIFWNIVIHDAAIPVTLFVSSISQKRQTWHSLDQVVTGKEQGMTNPWSQRQSWFVMLYHAIATMIGVNQPEEKVLLENCILIRNFLGPTTVCGVFGALWPGRNISQFTQSYKELEESFYQC